MKGLFDYILLRKYKSKGIIGLIVLGIVYFFLVGNYSMIRHFSKINQGNLDFSIINKCFSMGNLNKFLLFLFLVWAIGSLFQDKEEELKEVLSKGEEDKKKYFFNKALLIYGVSIVPMLINIFIKLIFYVPNRSIFSFDKVIVSSLYLITLVLFFTSVIFLMNLVVKDKMFAGVFPILFVEGLILMLSVSELLISDRLIWFRNFLSFIGGKILLVFNIAKLDFDNDVFSLGKQLIFIAVLFLVSVFLVYISRLLLKILNLKFLNRPYFFEECRYFIYVFMSVLTGFIFINALGYLTIMFIPPIGYVNGTFIVNIFSLVSIFLLFKFLNDLYKRNILDKDLVKDNENLCNEIQVCKDDSINVSESTGFLYNDEIVSKEEVLESSI